MKNDTIQITRLEAKYLCEALKTSIDSSILQGEQETCAATLAAWEEERGSFIARTMKLSDPLRETRSSVTRERKALDGEAKMLARLYPLVTA